MSSTTQEAERQYDRLYIGGEWVAPAVARLAEVRSPHDGRVIGSVPVSSPADIDRAVAAARSAFDTGDWSGATVAERSAVLGRFADLYTERVGELAELITHEMGSTITFSNLVQAPGALGILQTFRAIAEGVPVEEVRQGVTCAPTVRQEPVGVVGAIVPWNVPQALLMSKLAPALLAGCTVVAKPAPETPLDALLIAELLDEAGLPPGVVSIVPGDREVGEHLVCHPDVDKIAFTGSAAAGRRIGALCGEQLKRLTLELGGKSAAIILDDANLAATMQGLAFASFMLNGEACVAQTRILVSRTRHDEVVAALAELTAGLAVGDPMDPATAIGPMASERQRARVDGYIELGIQEGARVVVGGPGRPEGLSQGAYVQPTLFDDVENGMRIAQEEIFGPVLAVISYDDEADAVRLANESSYGLAGSVWTEDVEKGMSIARRVRTGTFGINQYTYDFAAPFGGFKGSGFGREYGREGFEAYLESKAIYPLAAPAA